MKGPKGASLERAWLERAYIWAIVGLGAALLVRSLAAPPPSEGEWLTLAVLAVCAAVAQLFPVVTPRNQAYEVTPLFIFAGVLLLPPSALSLLAAVAFLPEWVKARKPARIQLFNIANCLVNVSLAQALLQWIDGRWPAASSYPWDLLAAALAALLYTLANHLLLAVVLHLARGHTWRETGLFEPDNLITDASVAGTGIIASLLWQASPWLVAAVAAPLYLIYRALNTPNLQEQARTDGKTGLYNAKYFQHVLHDELARATRFDRPLAVIMADMDLLRNINNTYGHLAGDVVLKGVAEVIRQGLREYDLAARFGGEEFAILLPETDSEQALLVAERLRQEVEASFYPVPSSMQPIRATLSLGVAAFPAHGRQAEELVHQADLAVYYAKLRGRNCCWACSPESMALSPNLTGHYAMGVRGESPSVPPEVASRDDQQGPAGESAQARPTSHEEPASISHASESKGGTNRPGRTSPATSLPRRSVASRRQRATDPPWSVATLIAVLCLATAALWAFYRPWESSLDWVGLMTMVIITAAAQSTVIDIHGRGKISPASIPILASVILLGVPGALISAIVVPLTQWVLRRGILHRALFDVGGMTVCTVAAAFTYPTLASLLPSREPALLVLPILATAAVYYALNMGSLSLVMGLSERTSPWKVFDERFRWLFAYYLVFGLLSLTVALAYQAIGVYGPVAFFAPLLMLRYVMKQYPDRTEQSAVELRRVNDKLVTANAELTDALQELRATYDATLQALSAALDSRDTETEGHSQRVVEYTASIGRELGLSDATMAGLLSGALLHDAGKIGVPDAILCKRGSLTETEWQVMRSHPEVGYQMLSHVSFLSEALPIVRHHHEHFDGGGYPDGLKGEAIPLSARIFAIADAFDAMTSDRPYRSGRSCAAARHEIAACAGTQFDPAIVSAFLRIEEAELSRPLQQVRKHYESRHQQPSAGDRPPVVAALAHVATVRKPVLAD